MSRLLTLLPLTLAATTALAAPVQLHGGALDPVSASLALGLGGLVLWRTKAARA